MSTLRVALVAGEAAGVRALQSVLRAGHQLPVVMAVAAPGGARGADVGEVARSSHLEVWPAERIREPDCADALRALNIDLLLNVHALHVIPAAVLAVPSIGAFNLHPGPLPEYAGLDVVSWAIYNREPAHGVTLHWLDAGIDTGAVAYESRFPLQEGDTALTVYRRCIQDGLALIDQLLETAARDPRAIPRRVQGAGRHYYRRQVPNDGWIDWSQGADDILAFIRACDYGPLPSPWGKPKTKARGQIVEVLAAQSTGERADAPPATFRHGPDGSPQVAAADCWLRLTGVRPMESAVEPRAPSHA